MTNLGECELSYEELVSRNKSLKEELQQCSQDKEFVWNLWKELQVSNPNTTGIINSVLQREQEKSDSKDLKILNVLKEKDEQIRILQEISADLQIQLKHSNERISELLVEQSEWKKSLEDLNSEIITLKTEIDYKNQVLSTKDKFNEDVEDNVKQQVTELEEKINELLNEDALLHKKIDSLTENIVVITNEKCNLETNLVSKDQMLLSVQKELDIICKDKDVLMGENEAAKKSITKLKGIIKRKTKEVDDVRGYWESEVNKNTKTINLQCERLEQQQQQVLSLQQELSSHENCLKRIDEQSHLIEKLEGLQDESQKVLTQQHCTYEEKANLHKKTIKVLKKKLSQLQRETVKTACEKSFEKTLPLSPVGDNFEDVVDTSPNSMQQVEKCTQTIHTKHMESMNKPATTTDTKAESYAEMLIDLIKGMEVNVEATKTAHQRRLERYKLLEENCDLLCQQLATYEDGASSNEKKIPRASAKSLQRENSGSVWNELEYYRKQYEKFKYEEPKLNEELDRLKVEQSNSNVLIHRLKVKVEDLRTLLHEKETEIENKEKILLADTSKVKSLQSEALICNRKLSCVEKDYSELQKTYKAQVKREDILQKELASVVAEMELLKNQKSNQIMNDKEMQRIQNCDVTKEKETQTSEKIPEEKVISNVPSLELCENCSLEKCLLSVATQTSFICKEESTQTIESSFSLSQAEIEKSEKEEENGRISCQYEELLTINANMKKENEKLKQKKLKLEEEVKKALQNEQAVRIYANTTEKTNEKLKLELVENLQQLKEATDAMENKSQQVKDLSRELDIALANEKKENVGSKKKEKKIKSLEKELEEALSKCTKQSFEVKTFQGENEMLCDKQKTFQERVGKLEKDLIKRKSQFDEMKLKWEESKNDSSQKSELIEKLTVKVKELSDRESRKKIYVDELKAKIDSLMKDKSILQNTLSYLTVENNSKAELLHKTQHLCHQAESAINEIEISSITEMEKNQKLYTEKYNKLNLSYEKCFKQINEFKSAVKAFFEAIIVKISENHKTLIKMKNDRKKKLMEEKQSKLFEYKSNSIACSILGMSTQDLVEFMNDDNTAETENSGKLENKMRNKLYMILKKEFNFEKILVQFLLDLVKHNEDASQKQYLIDK